MTAIQALLAFTGWTLALVGWVAAYRIARFVKGAPINSWPRGAARQDDPPIMRRIEDAHANCLENLPVFAVLVLAGAALGKLPSIDVLAACVFYSRVAQSLAHALGTDSARVHIRAAFFTAQVVLFVMMFVRLLA